MRQYGKISIIFVVLIIAVFSIGGLTGQDIETEEQYYSGSVVEVDSSQIVLVEYDWETEKDIKLVFKVDNNTVLNNVKKIAEIAVDQLVSITYTEKENKKLAVVITVDTEVSDDEDISVEKEE